MAGAEEVFANLPSPTATTYACLVLNRKGLDRALETTHDRDPRRLPGDRDVRQRTRTRRSRRRRGWRRRSSQATDLKTTATVSVAFGCPFEGQVDPGLVIEHAHRMAAAGADEVILADTIGVGVPRQVKRARAAGAGGAASPSALHMHNTRNTGYANAIAGARARRDDLRRERRRPRRLSVRAPRDRQHRHRGPDLPAGERGRRDRSRPRRADRRRGVAGATLGRDLPGLVQRAGNFRLTAGRTSP